MSNTTQKKKWSVAILQSSMKKKVQKSFSSIILNILVNNSNKSSLEQIAKTVNERINKVTFGEWNVIVGRNFCNAIRYNVRYFYYSRALKDGVKDLEFMIYRCGPKVPSVITENNNNNNNNTNTNQEKTVVANNNNSEMDMEIDSAIFDSTKVVVLEQQMSRPMMKTMMNIFRLSLSQKNTPIDDVDMLHTLSSKFIKSRLSMLYETKGHWQVIVGDATALEGAVNHFEENYAVLRAGNHKAIVFSHADNNVEPLTANEKLTKLFYGFAIAAFIVFLILQYFVRNQICESKDSECTKIEIKNATLLGYYIDKIPVLIITLLLGATSIRILNTMFNR